MNTNSTKWIAAAGFAVVSLTLVAWKSSNNTHSFKSVAPPYEDTIKPRKKTPDNKKEFYTGDLDKAMRELDEVMIDMNKNIKIDLGKMNIEMKAAMDEVKKIDFEKIGHDVEVSLKDVDWSKMKVEVENALHLAAKEIGKIDMKEVQKEMARAHESIAAAKISSHIDMHEINEQIERGISDARSGVQRARKEIGLLKEFTLVLEKDGLIDGKKGYKLEIKNNELYINGTKQSKDVTDKYRKYFKDGNYTLSSDGDDND